MARMFAAMVVALTLVPLCVAPARASWVYVPPGILMLDADAVVVGKMTQVDKAAGTGLVAVSKVLKGPKDLKEAKVAFSPMPAGGPVHSAMISYNNDQEGVWILQKKDAAGAYPLNYPLLHQDKNQVEAVKKELDAWATRKWSDPVDGLAASCVVSVWPSGGKTALGFVVVKNTSDKPLRVSNYVGARPLDVTVVSPDGKEQPVNLYGWLAAARLRAPQASDYPEIAPGASCIVGAQYGFHVPVDKPGQYKVKATYSNTDDGKNLGLKNVWTGKIALPEVTFKP